VILFVLWLVSRYIRPFPLGGPGVKLFLPFLSTPTSLPYKWHPLQSFASQVSQRNCQKAPTFPVLFPVLWCYHVCSDLMHITPPPSLSATAMTLGHKRTSPVQCCACDCATQYTKSKITSSPTAVNLARIGVGVGSGHEPIRVLALRSRRLQGLGPKPERSPMPKAENYH